MLPYATTNNTVVTTIYIEAPNDVEFKPKEVPSPSYDDVQSKAKQVPGTVVSLRTRPTCDSESLHTSTRLDGRT